MNGIIAEAEATPTPVARKNEQANRATMRSDCVSMCSDYDDKLVTYMEGQMDRQMK